MSSPAAGEVELLQKVPHAVRRVALDLWEAGHEAYLVGGCVRDLLRGQPVQDFDVTTSAAPEAVLARFPHAVPIGLRHGTVMIPTRVGPVDVTSYREGRHLEDDLAHRDFTINAIAIDPRSGALMDPQGGRDDLAARYLRAVGSAADRLAADPLRALRAIRLVATLSLALDPELEKALGRARAGLRRTARERVRVELERMLVSPGARTGLKLLRRSGIEADLASNVRENAPEVVDALPPDIELRLAGWLRGTNADGVLGRLRFSKRTVRRVARLVQMHPIDAHPRLDRDVEVRKLLRRAGPECVDALLALCEAEIAAAFARGGPLAGGAEVRREHVRALRVRLESARETEHFALQRVDLALRGLDVMRILGCRPGPRVGRALQNLTERVIEDPSRNTPERLQELLLAWDGSERRGRRAEPAQAKETLMSEPIDPFRIEVPEADLDDLRERLARTRFPDQLEGAGWEYGTELGYLRELCAYWRERFEWRSQEAQLNRFEHFRTPIDGLPLHFIHARSPHEDALPLVIMHGWPGSVYEFHKIIEPLAHPEAHGGRAQDAFHVVCPSMPGYGWSDPPRRPGFDVKRMAGTVAALMDRLGYRRYGAQGGDWGAIVSSWLGRIDPERACGIHLNMVVAFPPPGVANPAEGLAPEELQGLARMGDFQKNETAYQQIQGTKPQTLGYGLNDSPAGLAAWIVEKLRTWSDCDGDVERRFTKDEILTNVMIYWVTQSITSSARLYCESMRSGRFGPVEGKVEVPVGAAIFPKEIFQPPRSWAEHHYAIRRWTRMPAGGHFAALEEPDALVEDIRAFFRDLR